jgi:hypothetical protein
MDFENKIINKDILNKLYLIFEDIEQTQMVDGLNHKLLSYRMVQDDENYFIMIDQESLTKILNKIPRKKIKKST